MNNILEKSFRGGKLVSLHDHNINTLEKKFSKFSKYIENFFCCYVLKEQLLITYGGSLICRNICGESIMI